MRLELFDPVGTTALAAHLRSSGFLVVRRGCLLDVHLRNHVSCRYDSLKAQEVLRAWVATHGVAVLVEPDVATERRPALLGPRSLDAAA